MYCCRLQVIHTNKITQIQFSNLQRANIEPHRLVGCVRGSLINVNHVMRIVQLCSY